MQWMKNLCTKFWKQVKQTKRRLNYIYTTIGQDYVHLQHYSGTYTVTG